LTSQTVSSTSAPTVRYQHLHVDNRLFYGIYEADYVRLQELVKALATKLAIPRKEVQERVERMIKHADSPSIFLVARDVSDEKIVGICIAEVGDTANTKHVGWLRIDVHPDYQRQGIGTNLLDMMMVEAKEDGLRRLEITSYEPNIQARKLFQKIGFKTEGKHLYARRDPSTGEYINTYTLARIL
jgi:ribosomal protein S18 acetylase RimI-like enzyme